MSGKASKGFISEVYSILRVIRLIILMSLTLSIVYVYYLSTKGLLLKKMAPVFAALGKNPAVLIGGLAGLGFLSFIFYLGYLFGKSVHSK